MDAKVQMLHPCRDATGNDKSQQNGGKTRNNKNSKKTRALFLIPRVEQREQHINKRLNAQAG